MTYLLDQYKVELFPVDRASLASAANALEAYEVSAHFSPGCHDLITDEHARYWHLSQLLSNDAVLSTVRTDDGHSSLVFVGNPNLRDDYYAYNLSQNEYKIYIGKPKQAKLDPLGSDSDFYVCQRLIIQQMRKSLFPKYEVGRHQEICDTTAEITPRKSANSVLTAPVRVHPAITAQLRKFGATPDIFLGLSPRSVLTYKINLDSVMRNGIVEKGKITDVFPFVRLPSGEVSKLIGLYDSKTSSDPITGDGVFGGRSFDEFARVFYPQTPLNHPDSPLAVVGAQSGPRMFSCEAIHPSINFYFLDSFDPAYFSSLISKLKLESVKRLEQATEWTKLISSHFYMSEGSPIGVELTPYEMPAVSRPIDAHSVDNEKMDIPGGTFEPPPVSFRSSSDTRSVVDVIPRHTPGRQGTVNDLLSHPELKPLEAPRDANIIVFVHQSLERDWNKFEEALLKGLGLSGFRGLRETFGVNVYIKTEMVSDFLGRDFEERTQRLDERGYDCAVNVIPRFYRDLERTKLVYTAPKTLLMRRGIPVQAITNDERMVEGRDNTLSGKAGNSRVLFGIGCNIMAKIGVVLTALSKKFADEMIADSMIMGYDIARIFPSVDGVNESLERKRTSIPLAAPMVIFDNQGARIKHQGIYRPHNETSLFADHGSAIIEALDPMDTLIIHKDGSFRSEELRHVKSLASTFGSKIRRVVPISIVRSDVPRMFNPDYAGEGFELQSGTFLSLSPSEFLLTTTPIFRWEPQKKGWPCPLLVRIHDIGAPLAAGERLKLLYQIFALTKMHTGSQWPTRAPVSVHYSNMVASFLRKVAQPSPDYLENFVRPVGKEGLVPRWYI